ncbi:hypothetical protein EOS93_25270 [Rhizobium sp. RMa-01]|uniref:hypothetical protein n=1 Tax=unclassified Rhizobium TaxID=2613769 RepID=UPI0008DB0D67|nr:MULTISPECIES: hypothetical protein [unclassified Rhizobium]OHV24930.1 hypothetical protein BBJ66_22565 [Rhizobium sp. RSm-3]RVU08362.1 hypothetical protein EOS93_25270 [Rhizobium sp. RMa-01]
MTDNPQQAVETVITLLHATGAVRPLTSAEIIIISEAAVAAMQTEGGSGVIIAEMASAMTGRFTKVEKPAAKPTEGRVWLCAAPPGEWSSGRIETNDDMVQIWRDRGYACTAYYSAPKPTPKEWRCFHCDDVFTDKRQAALHFGCDETSEPACKIKAGAEGSMLEALRRAEAEAQTAISAMHNESTEGWNAYYNIVTRASQQAEAAENLGYERGLQDGRTDPPQGWQLVPEYITEDMRDALTQIPVEYGSTLRDNATDIYNTLLSAAPRLEDGNQGEEL